MYCTQSVEEGGRRGGKGERKGWEEGEGGRKEREGGREGGREEREEKTSQSAPSHTLCACTQECK